MVVSEITTGDHSKRADGCERSRFRTAQRVLAITITHDLALASSRQVEVAGEYIARIVAALAVGPALVVSIAEILKAIAGVIEVTWIKIPCPTLQ